MSMNITSSSECPECNSLDILYDENLQTLICANCDYIFEPTNIDPIIPSQKINHFKFYLFGSFLISIIVFFTDLSILNKSGHHCHNPFKLSSLNLAGYDMTTFPPDR